ncbi:MAG: 1-acyl-sn-glycerol-3-phosphate acyltransferase [Candidatus Promineifilaceae bacterium]|jgi:1-acyl-sn-glycerol-3-phosphate acyltransferase
MTQATAEKRSPNVHWLLKLFAQGVLKLFGWTTEVDEALVHAYPKYILVAAPHTSNWDAVFGWLGFMAEDIGASIIIKQEWLNTPLIGRLLSSIGCVGIDRSGSQSTIRQVVDLFEKSPRFVMVIAPEGTRDKVEQWKAGFYFIAKKAKVPLMLGGPDYRRKVCTIAPIVVQPTGDIEADMNHFKPFLDQITPRHPQKKSEMVFRSK